MVKKFDGGAFSNPTMNGLQSQTNPLVPGTKGENGFDPLDLFWWLKQSQMIGQKPINATTYVPNRFTGKT
jgi:hypothetical protein